MQLILAHIKSCFQIDWLDFCLINNTFEELFRILIHSQRIIEIKSVLYLIIHSFMAEKEVSSLEMVGIEKLNCN